MLYFRFRFRCSWSVKQSSTEEKQTGFKSGNFPFPASVRLIQEQWKEKQKKTSSHQESFKQQRDGEAKFPIAMTHSNFQCGDVKQSALESQETQSAVSISAKIPLWGRQTVECSSLIS